LIILSRLGYFQPMQKLQPLSARSIYCKTTLPRLGTAVFGSNTPVKVTGDVLI
jgi:hypothetical protein